MVTRLENKLVMVDSYGIDSTRFPAEEEWSEAAVIRYNNIYGNHVVSNRLIKKGELLIEEFPLSAVPYGPEDRLPFCLTCGKDLALSERCSKCKWPICNNEGSCEEDPDHAEGECPIFVTNQVRPKDLSMSEYTAVETLRCLLLRSRNPSKWERILSFEAHSSGRRLRPAANAETENVMEFLVERCKVTDFDHATLDQVIGVFAINTFWALDDTDRNISLLFDKVTLLSHSCDPNTKRRIMEKEVIVNGRIKTLICIQIRAARVIEPGEEITIGYTGLKDNVRTRQKRLRDLFYFTCKCERCVRELSEDANLSEDDQ